MPDWTYHPFRRIAATLLGERRSQLAALRLLAKVGSLPGGGRIVACGLGHRHPPRRLAGRVAGVSVHVRLGAVVPPKVAHDAIRALPLLGAGVIEIGPVHPEDVPTVRKAVAGRRIPVIARASPEARAAVAQHVDAVVAGDFVHPHTISQAAQALADPSTVVMATTATLIREGPGWFARVIDAATPAGGKPHRAWVWGALLGVGMIVAGLAAVAITLGPLLLWYDRDYLGVSAVDHHLAHFLQHDRISLAGTMIAIGVLYTGLSQGIRRGHLWAREALSASGWLGFPTLFYFVGTGFVDVLHLAATVTLFPFFLLATRRRGGRRRTPLPDGPERQRRRALVGQLLLVITGLGIAVGGAVVSVVGLTTVFVPSDLTYLHTTGQALQAANPRLLPFIAHDRAGFGGALISAGVGIALLSAWGWRRGESWVWWTLTLAAISGFGCALTVHGEIGYTDLGHLAPAYAGLALTIVALALARPYLCARRPIP
ncbi:hypothetical protein [Kutzneria buriramensis]|uniref:DUF998 domain-containing protein n=1 Tax=Kutzneria buriramensis TaxID=1045776 RepID=A0A3E0I815_9PSEU|nr:hypothetical protein [Kutzneria buriramensis]REH54285.1 hypothetical protein BCF44_102517 [Kutzneria buriramensis]